VTDPLPQILRDRLAVILTAEPALAAAFSNLGDLERAKFSRAKLLCKIARDNGADAQLATEASIGLELVHLATLIHDDVIDDADLRRDKKNLRSVKGDRCAILFGDYLFASAIKQVQNSQSSGLASAFIDRIVDTCRGESIQDLSLTWEDSTPTEALLTEAARGKTGALFAFCCEAPLWMNHENEELIQKARECGFLCGLAFQLADDLLDMAGSTDDLGKPAGNDLIKNTMTTPLFYFMEAKSLNWEELRANYATNTDQLKKDFFSSSAYPKLLERITQIKSDLKILGDELEQSNININETLSLFWSRYVQSRMTELKDAT
jgi:geranylgeranyl pyrophosphate synthase